MNTLSDKIVTWESHLIQRAMGGEQVAFELLIDLYRGSLHAMAYRMLRNHEDASDAVQDTVVKAFRAMKDFDSSRPFRPWLYRICSNCCVDMVRNRKRDGGSIDAIEHSLFDPSQDLDEHASGNFRQTVVREAVQNLPKQYRDIIFMRHYRHMDVNEIATALNKPEGTVKSWLFRARALLRKDLQIALG